MNESKKVSGAENTEFTAEEKEVINKFFPKESYFVQSTTKYEMFKFMDGNRDVTHDRPIRESMINVGQLPIPVIVNEFMEIADGQGRFTASKDLGLPVYYMVVEGLRLKHVRIINSIFQKWSTRNYIDSYCKSGSNTNDYVRLHRLLNDYNTYFTAEVIYMACGYRDQKIIKKIKDGTFEFDKDAYVKAIDKLEYLMKFKDCVQRIDGRISCMYRALLFCYDTEQIDKTLLERQFKNYYGIIEPLADVDQAIIAVEKIYNRQRPAKNYLDIHGLYKENIKVVNGLLAGKRRMKFK